MQISKSQCDGSDHSITSAVILKAQNNLTLT